MKIWKPRSRRNPSTTSVRTRPPTASEDSRRRKGMLREVSFVAAARPERPAPMIMTGGLVGEVVESCEVKMSRRKLWRRRWGKVLKTVYM